MLISHSRAFKKMFRKQPGTTQEKFEERITVFMNDPQHPLLHNHPLSGEWAGCRSINISGDIRAVYEEIATGHFEFVAIGTHSELYS